MKFQKDPSQEFQFQPAHKVSKDSKLSNSWYPGVYVAFRRSSILILKFS